MVRSALIRQIITANRSRHHHHANHHHRAAAGSIQPNAEERKRMFHASRRRENPIVIGLVIVVGATIARYLIRAANRVSKEEEKGDKGVDEDEDEDEQEDPAGGRGFPVLGSDIGTLYSCVGIATNKKAAPLIIENHEGRRSTPAFLAYEDGHLIVGQLARRGRWRDPTRVAFNIQRLLGTSYTDGLRVMYPFRVEPVKEGSTDVALSLSGGGRSVTAVEATTRLVENLVQSAEHKMHQGPKLAVFAVPSYFTAEGKRKALEAAQEGTGLAASGVEIVEDAVASLIAAHYSGAMAKAEGGGAELFGKPWLVVDIGGLNAQLSIVSLSQDNGLSVRANQTAWNVGGEQFDGVLVRHLVENFKKRHGGIDLGTDYLALERLYDASEAAKLELSSKVSSSIRLPFITADHKGPKHLDADLSRAQYENLIEPVLSHLREPYTTLLKEAKIKDTKELEGILITGGSSRLPFVANFVTSLTGRRPLSLDLPEESVALGCSYMGRELL